jgi:hypothetical protein
MNNFYNEPAFAERLLELSQQSAIPETMQEQFVLAVACCRAGNGYGVSNAAVPSYDQMVQAFSQREIAILIKSAKDTSNSLGRRIANSSSCRINFKELLALIDPASVPSAVKSDYERMIGS